MENIELIPFSEVAEEEISWLYYPYIAYGKVTLLCGDPGCGKTTLALALSSILSNGAALPLCEEQTKPIHILYQSAEDGIGDTIVPKLKLFRAEMANIAAACADNYVSFHNPQQIEEAIQRHNARLVVFDPFQAFIGKANMSSANEMRSVVRQIAEVAQRQNCAVLILCHLNKSTAASNLLYRIVGSVDIAAIARSALYLTDHPTKKNTKLLCQIKNNLAPLGQSIEFQITANGICWLGYSDISEKDLLRQSSDGAFQNAVDFLKMLLANENMPSAKVYNMAANAGIGFTTLKKAKRHLGIKAAKIGNSWYFMQYYPKEVIT